MSVQILMLQISFGLYNYNLVMHSFPSEPFIDNLGSAFDHSQIAISSFPNSSAAQLSPAFRYLVSKHENVPLPLQ